MLEDKQTAASSIRSLKRKASNIEEAGNAPDQSHSRALPAHRQDSDHGKAAEGNAELTARPSVLGSLGGPSDSSSSAFRSTSADEENEHNYTPGTSFTSINRRVSREQSDAAVYQRTLDGSGKDDGNQYPGTAAETTDLQAQLMPNVERLTVVDRKHLVAAVAEVESYFEKEKWNLVAQAMRRAGAATYSTDVLMNELVQRVRSSTPNATEHEILNQAWKDVLWKIKEAPGVGTVFTRPSPYDNGVICSLSKSLTSPRDGAALGNVLERLNFQILPTDILENPLGRPRNAATTARDVIEVDGSDLVKPLTSNYQGFGVLVNQGPLQYNTQHIPPNIRSRMAQQEHLVSRPIVPQTGSSAQRILTGSVPVYSTMSPVQGPFAQPATQRALLSYRPSHESVQEQESTASQDLTLAPVDVTQSKPSTPTTTIEAANQENKSVSKSRKVISKSNLKYMLRHRTLNEVNKNKPWDVIARECGVDAPLNEISVALEQAGFPSILYTPTGAPVFVSNPVSSTVMSPSSVAYVSPYDSISPIIPTTDSRSPPPLVKIDPTKENDIALSSTQAVQNPYTGTKLPYSSTPGTEPIQSKEERDPLQDSHEKRSAAMRKAWAKRQAEGRNGRHGGPPRSSTLARNTTIGSSPIVFATQVLAAAEAEVASPSRITPYEKERTSSTPPQATPAEEVIVASSAQGRSQLGKKRGQYKKKDDPPEEAPAQSNHYPYQNTFMFADDKPCPYACDKCGKAYTTPGGLNYHRASKPNCEAETPKPRPFECDKCGKSYQNKGGLSYHKTQYPTCDPDPEPSSPEEERTEHSQPKESKRLSGPKIIGGARIPPQEL